VNEPHPTRLDVANSLERIKEDGYGAAHLEDAERQALHNFTAEELLNQLRPLAPSLKCSFDEVESAVAFLFALQKETQQPLFLDMSSLLFSSLLFSFLIVSPLHVL